MAEARVDARVLLVAIVGVDRMASAAPGRAIVTRLVVGAHEPRERIVEPRLVDVEHGDRDAQARAGTAVGLADVGPARLLKALNLAERIRQADFRKLRADVAPAAFEHAEIVGRRHDFPGRQRIKHRQRAARGLLRRHRTRRRAGRQDARRLAVMRVGLAEQVVLVRQNAVVVGRAAPQHHARRHHRTFGGVDDLQMARAAGLARGPVVGRVHEPHEFRRLAIEQRERLFRVSGMREIPALRIARQHVRAVARGGVVAVARSQAAGDLHRRIAAVTVDAAEHDARTRVHARRVGGGVAGKAAFALGVRGLDGLAARRGGRAHKGVVDVVCAFAFVGARGRRRGARREETRA